MAVVEAQEMKRLLRSLANIEPDEIGCDTCFEVVDRFVELELEGKDAEEALPLVKDHLNRCEACREEYRALYQAVKKLTEKSPEEDLSQGS